MNTNYVPTKSKMSESHQSAEGMRIQLKSKMIVAQECNMLHTQ